MAGNAPSPSGLMAADHGGESVACTLPSTIRVACICAIYPMSGGTLPFNRPNIGALSFPQQMAYQVFQPLVFFIFLAVIYWLTRRRAVPDKFFSIK